MKTSHSDELQRRFTDRLGTEFRSSDSKKCPGLGSQDDCRDAACLFNLGANRPSTCLHLFQREAMVVCGCIAAVKAPLSVLRPIRVIAHVPYQLCVASILQVDTADSTLSRAVETDRVRIASLFAAAPNNAFIANVVMRFPSPKLRAGVAAPPVREEQQIANPPLVVSKVVLGPAVDEHVPLCTEVCRAVVVVDGWEEVSEVTVAAWTFTVVLRCIADGLCTSAQKRNSRGAASRGKTLLGALAKRGPSVAKFSILSKCW